MRSWVVRSDARVPEAARHRGVAMVEHQPGSVVELGDLTLDHARSTTSQVISKPSRAVTTTCNTPPFGQPGLWCQWVPTDDGHALVWNGHEKFYRSSGWMR